jgi:hypothetical protein
MSAENKKYTKDQLKVLILRIAETDCMAMKDFSPIFLAYYQDFVDCCKFARNNFTSMGIDEEPYQQVTLLWYLIEGFRNHDMGFPKDEYDESLVAMRWDDNIVDIANKTLKALG